MLRRALFQAIFSGPTKASQFGVSNYDLLRQAAARSLSSQSIANPATSNGINRVELDCVVQDVSESSPMPSGEPSVLMTVAGFGELDDRVQVLGTGPLAATLSGLLPGATIRLVGRLGVKQPPLQPQHPKPTLQQEGKEGATATGGGAPNEDASSTHAQSLSPQQPPPQSPMMLPYILGLSVTPLPEAGAGSGGSSSAARQEEELAHWEALRRNPKEWYDNRMCKTGKQPDFKRRDKSAALWISSRNAPEWLLGWLATRDGAHVPSSPSPSHTTQEGHQTLQQGRGQRPMTLAAKRESEAAAWEALRSNPDGWFDNRNSKANPRAPDFKRKDGNGVLWTSSYNRPVWLDEWLAGRDGERPVPSH